MKIYTNKDITNIPKVMDDLNPEWDILTQNNNKIIWQKQGGSHKMIFHRNTGLIEIWNADIYGAIFTESKTGLCFYGYLTSNDILYELSTIFNQVLPT